MTKLSNNEYFGIMFYNKTSNTVGVSCYKALENSVFINWQESSLKSSKQYVDTVINKSISCLRLCFD